jgi:hypothetical protein
MKQGGEREREGDIYVVMEGQCKMGLCLARIEWLLHSRCFCFKISEVRLWWFEPVQMSGVYSYSDSLNVSKGSFAPLTQAK